MLKISMFFIAVMGTLTEIGHHKLKSNPTGIVFACSPSLSSGNFKEKTQKRGFLSLVIHVTLEIGVKD